jgi:hypothetical protein
MTAYTEVQIDEDSISLTLISESADGVTIEDTERFTFEELQDMAGEHLTLSLSQGSVEDLSEQREDANVGRIMAADGLEEKAEEVPDSPESEELLAYMGLLEDDTSDEATSEPRYPQAGEVVYDESAPSWSNDERVKVVEVLSDVTCDEYVIQGQHEGEKVHPTDQSWNDETVADANPGCSDDEPVIIGEYVDGDSTEYAFPASRLQRSP